MSTVITLSNFMEMKFSVERDCLSFAESTVNICQKFDFEVRLFDAAIT